MNDWKKIGLILLAAVVVFLAGRWTAPEPERLVVDTSIYDSLSRSSKYWRGQADAYHTEADTANAILKRLQAARPTTPALIKTTRNAIRSAGFSAAIDTLRRKPK